MIPIPREDSEINRLLDRLEVAARAEPAHYRDGAGGRSAKGESARESLVQRDRAWRVERDMLLDARDRWQAWAIGLGVTFALSIAFAECATSAAFERSRESVLRVHRGPTP